MIYLQERRQVMLAYIFGLGVPELLVILAVVLIIFGPKKLPEIGKALGSTIKELRKSAQPEETPEKTKAEATQSEAEVAAKKEDTTSAVS